MNKCQVSTYQYFAETYAANIVSGNWVVRCCRLNKSVYITLNLRELTSPAAFKIIMKHLIADSIRSCL